MNSIYCILSCILMIQRRNERYISARRGSKSYVKHSFVAHCCCGCSGTVMIPAHLFATKQIYRASSDALPHVLSCLFFSYFLPPQNGIAQQPATSKASATYEPSSRSSGSTVA